MNLPIYELKISEDLNDESEVSYVALVDEPAIKKDFLAFKDEFIEPSKGEHQKEFIDRCVKYVIDEGKEPEQAVAICNSIWEQHFAENKISFDYDETLNTERGMALAKKLIAEGNVVYIISARNEVAGMLDTAKELGIPESRVFATGSNSAKIEKVKSLGVNKHYDNNADVIKELGSIGEKFAETYNDYPDAASENAKTALRWVEKNGWGDCGTAVGKIRANQLANKENISEETIARMAGFERHRQNSNRPLGEGCGRLMWLAWGGDEGIAWASRKLKQIRNQKFSFAIKNEEQKIISGPLMIADELIYRNNETFGEHYVKFSRETIKAIAIKFAKKKYQNHVNLMHSENRKVDGVTMFESFIVDRSRGIMPMAEFSDVADGSWFGSFYVENEDVWKGIKSGEFKGFSVEGIFSYEEPNYYEKQLQEIKQLLGIIENNFGGPGSGRHPEDGSSDNKAIAEANTKAINNNYNDKNVAQENTKLLLSNKEIDTQKLYYDNKTKDYNEERKLFQSNLTKEYLSQGSTNLGTSYFMGGAPATGKSSIVDSGDVVLPKGILVVDSDNIKSKMPEYNEMVKQRISESASKVHEESSTISKGIINEATEKGYDLVNDGVGDGSYESVLKKVEQQRKNGKKVVAHYVTTDVETSLNRARLRGEKTGRIVPEDYIKSMHSEISHLVPKLAKNGVFDELNLFDTNSSKPKLIMSAKGNKITIHDKNAYDKFLKKAKRKN